MVQLAKEIFYELWIAVPKNSLACQTHQIKLIVDVVHSQQVGSGSLFCSDMVDVGTSDAETALRGRTAAGTLATLLDRSKILGVYGVAEVENAS
jgi:hypothetical protein